MKMAKWKRPTPLERSVAVKEAMELNFSSPAVLRLHQVLKF
jgi:hypothetical protein